MSLETPLYYAFSSHFAAKFPKHFSAPRLERGEKGPGLPIALLESSPKSGKVTRWKFILPPAATGLLLAGVALLLREPSPDAGPLPPAARAVEPGWTAVDFAALKPGGQLPGWKFRHGAISLVEKDGRLALQQAPDPMTEGTVIQLKMLPGGGAVRARFFGERARRSTPRFALGMHGDLKVHLRAVPATDTLEIVLSQPVEENGKLVERDVLKASAPWEWNPQSLTWIEFQATHSPQGCDFEGRIWTDGSTRPASPSLRWDCPESPGILRAAVQMAPFALRPVYCDAIETTQNSARP